VFHYVVSIVHQSLVVGFEVEVARWVGRGVRGTWGPFKPAAKDAFRSAHVYSTNEYAAPSHGRPVQVEEFRVV